MGFLLTALIAGFLAGGTTLTRVQSLHQQSEFYQQLLQSKTAIASGSPLLELMNIQMHEILTLANDPISLEIIASEQEILVASELKDLFIAGISHELRNPLTNIFGWLKILIDHHQELDEQTRMPFPQSYAFSTTFQSVRRNKKRLPFLTHAVMRKNQTHFDVRKYKEFCSCFPYSHSLETFFLGC